MNAIPLDKLHNTYNSADQRITDPVQFIYRYRRNTDRELAGFIASCLAYGKVEIILNSVRKALLPLGPSPADTVCARSPGPAELLAAYRDFSHRLNEGPDIVILLLALRPVLRKYGSLRKLFSGAWTRYPGDIRSSLSLFAETVRNGMKRTARKYGIRPGYCMHLVPSPREGGACKRLNLFLKWMVRKDRIDPGTWHNALGHIAPHLVIPLDVHIGRMARECGFTRRKTDNWKTAEEITGELRKLCPGDPVRYDFSLCHAGMEHSRRKRRPRAV